jgi:hypothetical protein
MRLFGSLAKGSAAKNRRPLFFYAQLLEQSREFCRLNIRDIGGVGIEHMPVSDIIMNRQTGQWPRQRCG